jgi:hypothetical protein
MNFPPGARAPTLQSVVSISEKIYGRGLPPLQLKVGDIFFDRGLLYILLDDARRLRVLNVRGGDLVGDEELPVGFDGVEARSWEGVAVVHSPEVAPNVWLFLAQDHPAEIWRYNFSLTLGLPSCASSVLVPAENE